MRMVRVSVLVLGLTLLPAAAQAGPVWFTYHIETSIRPGEDDMNVFRSNGPAGDFTLDYHADGRASFPWPSGQANLMTLHLTPQLPPDRTPDSFGNVWGRTAFTITVRLTDEASGASNAITIGGNAFALWAHQADGSLHMVDAAISPGRISSFPTSSSAITSTSWTVRTDRFSGTVT